MTDRPKRPKMGASEASFPGRDSEPEHSNDPLFSPSFLKHILFLIILLLLSTPRTQVENPGSLSPSNLFAEGY